MFRFSEYHLNYATVKARGVAEADIVYTLTVHKKPVRKSGYEFKSSISASTPAIFNASFGGDEQGVSLDGSRFSSSLIRSKQVVIQYVANNPWEYFVTLTVSPDSSADRFSLADCKRKILKFFSNYKHRFNSGFKYLIIPEQHRDGAWHFHGVMMGINPDDLEVNKYGYLDFKPYSSKFGYFSTGSKVDEYTVGKIRDLKKCASYISKYISKDMFVGESIEDGASLYFASKGLKKDKVLIVGESVVSPNEFLELGYQGFDNEYCVKVEFEDEDIAVSCVKGFSPDFKLGVSFSAYGDIVGMSDDVKNGLIRKAVSKVCRYLKVPFPKGERALSALWSEILTEYCYILSDYDRLKEERREIKKRLYLFVQGCTDCTDVLDESVFNDSISIFENVSLLE